MDLQTLWHILLDAEGYIPFIHLSLSFLDMIYSHYYTYFFVVSFRSIGHHEMRSVWISHFVMMIVVCQVLFGQL